jgi:NADH-quinone oxidoreductase subunit L
VVVVAGIVNGVAAVVRGFSGILRYVQTGFVHNYAFSMVLGVVLIVAVYLFR